MKQCKHFHIEIVFSTWYQSLSWLNLKLFLLPFKRIPSALAQAQYSFSIKLTSTNFLVWKTQFSPILKCYNLRGHVDGSTPAPPETIINPTSKEEEFNLAFTSWVQDDQILLS